MAGAGPGYLTYEEVDKFCLATNFKIGFAGNLLRI
jgi:hypothetical protein